MTTCSGCPHSADCREYGGCRLEDLLREEYERDEAQERDRRMEEQMLADDEDDRRRSLEPDTGELF